MSYRRRRCVQSSSCHTGPQNRLRNIRQKTLHDIKMLYKAKQASEERPKWNEYSGESPTCKSYFHEWRRIEMWKNVLYRRWENNAGTETRLQLIVPTALQRTLCREIHDGRTTCHMGKKRVLRLLNKTFFWYKMDKDVAWWIRTCEICQRRMRPTREPKAPMTIYVTGFPGERVAMDVVGPLKESKSGNKYVLCITDHFSKFSRAFAMPDQVAKRVARIFVDEWVCQWGEPMALHTDQGSNFESELLAQVCDLMKVPKTRTSPYHPQGNAQTERYNQTIINIVAKLTDKSTYDDWDEQIPVAVAAYNATEHATTGFTPNRLMFNREMRHNFDKMLPEAVDPEKLETWDEYVQRMDQQTREAFQVARETIGRSVLLQKKYYDKNSNLIKYKVGDAVMVRDHRQHEAGTAKLSDKYDGPYFVIDVLSDVNFRLAKTENDKAKVIHHDRMHKIKERVEGDTSWVFKQSRTHQRMKADVGTSSGEVMKEVLDRITQLENKSNREAAKLLKKKNDRKKRNKPVTEPKDEQPEEQPKRKRGRPRKTENRRTSTTSWRATF